MPSITGQKWSCHSCGDCCKTLVGHLTDAERARLDEQGWTRELGVSAYVRIPRGWALNKRADGACVFLTDDNRCRIHAKFGEESKPLACRIFPFSVRRVSNGWQASLRFDCPSVTSAVGAPLDQHRWSVGTLAAQIEQSSPPRPERIQLKRGRPASDREADALLARFERWLVHGREAMGTRLVGAARFLALLDQARLGKVREERFVELVDLLVQALPGEAAQPIASPSPRQLAMLRQFAFAHLEHVTLDELRGGVAGRFRKRWQQLQKAKLFLHGAGLVPDLLGISGTASFAEVDAVVPAAGDREKVDDLLRRYLAARIEGRTTFAAGYYGWSMVAGLTACMLSVAVAGWIARLRAAASGRATFDFADAAAALGIVDRAATRLPALGALAERTRITYLQGDDGVARLLHRFPLTEHTA